MGLAIQRLKALQAKKHMLRKTRGGFDFDGPDDDDFAAMMALSGQMPFYPFMMDDMDDMFDDVFDDDYLPYAWMFGQSPFFPSFPTPTVSSDDTAAPTFPMFPFFDFDLSKANPQASRKMKQQYVRHQLRKAHQLRKTRADPTPTSKPSFPFLPFMMDDFFDFDFPFEFDDYLPYAMMFGNNASGMMKPFTDMFSSFFPTMDSTTTPSFPMWPFFMDELSKSTPSQQFKNRLMKHQLPLQHSLSSSTMTTCLMTCSMTCQICLKITTSTLGCSVEKCHRFHGTLSTGCTLLQLLLLPWQRPTPTESCNKPENFNYF